jgi:NADP-dependent 3-hydroxy acid dehydrogenase YdfG
MSERHHAEELFVIPQMKKQNSGHVVNISAAVLADQPSGRRARTFGGAVEVADAGCE